MKFIVCIFILTLGSLFGYEKYQVAKADQLVSNLKFKETSYGIKVLNKGCQYTCCECPGTGWFRIRITSCTPIGGNYDICNITWFCNSTGCRQLGECTITCEAATHGTRNHDGAELIDCSNRHIQSFAGSCGNSNCEQPSPNNCDTYGIP